VDGGVTLDRDRRRHDQRARAPERAFNAGITEINAGITEIDVTIAEIDAEIDVNTVITGTNIAIPITTVIANRGIAARSTEDEK
jgi:hypothetical protein